MMFKKAKRARERQKGRPKRFWNKIVEELFKQMHLTSNNARKESNDRERCRHKISSMNMD